MFIPSKVLESVNTPFLHYNICGYQELFAMFTTNNILFINTEKSITTGFLFQSLSIMAELKLV